MSRFAITVPVVRTVEIVRDHRNLGDRKLGFFLKSQRSAWLDRNGPYAAFCSIFL
jgi:hypothetical protein